MPAASILLEGHRVACTWVVVVSELETAADAHLVRWPPQGVLVGRSQRGPRGRRPRLVRWRLQSRVLADRTGNAGLVASADLRKLRHERTIGGPAPALNPCEPGPADRRRGVAAVPPSCGTSQRSPTVTRRFPPPHAKATVAAPEGSKAMLGEMHPASVPLTFRAADHFVAVAADPSERTKTCPSCA